MAQNVSDRFKKALTQGHKIAIKVELFRDGKLVTSFVSKTTLVISGEVGVQEDAERMARVSIVDPDGLYIPASFQSDFWYGREMRVYRGIDYLDGGSPEFVQLGVFRINEVRVTSGPRNRVMTIRGRDRSDKMRRARFTDVYEVAEGTNVATAIRNILTPAGIVSFNFVPTTSTTTKRSYQRAADRWDAARSIAEAAGYFLYFDAQGVCVMTTTPNPNTSPVSWKYDATDPTTHPILSAEKIGSDEQIYNRVIVTGESDKNVVRAEAFDNDPNSETYVGGDFGDVPYFRVVAATTSQADAQRLADSGLAQARRGTEEVSLSVLPNPAMDVGDVIYVKEPFAKIDGNYVVSYFTIPFERGASMTINTKKRRST